MIALEHLATLIRKTHTESAAGHSTEPQISQIRAKIADLSLADFVTGPVLKRSGVMTNGAMCGLFDPTILGAVNAPRDIQDDAFMLYQRWFRGDLEGDMFRGIESTRQTNDHRSFRKHKVEVSWPHKKSANFIGATQEDGTELRSGMWWPLQICAVRDGVHGEIEAGIAGKKEHGAYSVVLSGGRYANIDNGPMIEYCSTAAKAQATKPTYGTELLLEAHRRRQPIRVLRSSRSPSIWAPTTGIRYDGLSRIIATTIIDADTHQHRFTMRRLAGQTPIRYRGAGEPEARPSVQEMAVYERLRDLLSGRGG